MATDPWDRAMQLSDPVNAASEKLHKDQPQEHSIGPTQKFTIMTTENHDGDLFDVPDNLAARCVRIHGWSDSFAASAIKGYSQFMKLKLQHEDWNATVLSPSLPVDLVWHQHMLVPRHYADACKDYARQIIDHNPDGGLDQKARSKRVKMTKFALKTLFGKDIDEKIWKFDDEEKESNNKRRCLSLERDFSVDMPPEIPPASLSSLSKTPVINISMHIHVKSWLLNGSSKVVTFKVKETTMMEKIFDEVADMVGVDGVHLRFLLDGERIEPTQTPKTLELDSDDFIFVVEEHGGC